MQTNTAIIVLSAGKTQIGKKRRKSAGKRSNNGDSGMKNGDKRRKHEKLLGDNAVRAFKSEITNISANHEKEANSPWIKIS